MAGYDNVEAAAHMGLTSVAGPMRLMGQVAARRAIDLLTNDEKQDGDRLQVRLVVRESSAGRRR
jgi:DNA-binding LacI/PurR family transcriptional regulator